MRILLLLSLSAIACCSVAEPALRDDGKQVELHTDGTWTLISDDVLATSTSGLRVRLLPDGSWQPLEGAQASAALAVSAEDATHFNSDVSLERIQIQKVKVSRASSKNAVYEHNMVATLRFEKALDSALLLANSFTVEDEKGRVYPVIAVNSGVENQVVLRAQGAPDRWSRTKWVAVVLDKQLLSTLADVRLRVDFRDIKTKVVSEFGAN